MSEAAQVGIVTGSTEDWSVMEYAANTLEDFGVPWVAGTMDKLPDFAGSARANGLKAIIAGADNDALLADMTTAHTDVPVLAVPIDSSSLNGLDALQATIRMPGGTPAATFAIGKAGAINAALFAVAMLANDDPEIAAKLAAFRKKQSDKVKAAVLPPLDPRH
jgi:5-(carboxyamino)imidazole ribonucleotide mutase